MVAECGSIVRGPQWLNTQLGRIQPHCLTRSYLLLFPYSQVNQFLVCRLPIDFSARQSQLSPLFRCFRCCIGIPLLLFCCDTLPKRSFSRLFLGLCFRLKSSFLWRLP